MDDSKGYGGTYGGFGSPNQYAGAGGFDRAGNDGFGASQSQSPGSRKPKDQKTLRAVLIKSILGVTSADEAGSIDGKPVNQITLVAQIVSVDEQNTALTFLLDDGTGQVNCKLYVDSNESPNPDFRPGQYVRVYGNMNSFANQRIITIFRMLPVTDHNEITFHHLEAINHHLQATKGKPKNAAAGAPGMHNQGAVSSSGANNGMNMTGAPINHNMNMGGANENFTPIQQQVLQVFETAVGNETGTDINHVCKQLPHISRGDIRASVDFLCGEGHLYSTIDEDHFRSTSS